MSQRNAMPYVLVTGGTGVVGMQLLQQLPRRGYHVLYTTRDAGRKAALDRVGDDNTGDCVGIVVDLEHENYLPVLLQALWPYLAGIRGVVHNARSLAHLRIDERGRMPRQNWLASFTLDVVVPYELTLALLDAPCPLQSVVMISSMYGVVAANRNLYDDFDKQSPINYGPVKAASIHLAKEMAVRLAGQSVRVNAISFGGIAGRAPDAFVKRYSAMVPAGQMLQPADVVGPIAFLLSDESKAITGHNLISDGGWTTW